MSARRLVLSRRIGLRCEGGPARRVEQGEEVPRSWTGAGGQPSMQVDRDDNGNPADDRVAPGEDPALDGQLPTATTHLGSGVPA
jgi:hypothetical protein